MYEAVDRSTGVHHRLTLVDELRCDVAKDVHAEQQAVVASEDQLHEAIRPTVDHLKGAIIPIVALTRGFPLALDRLVRDPESVP